MREKLYLNEDLLDDLNDIDMLGDDNSIINRMTNNCNNLDNYKYVIQFNISVPKNRKPKWYTTKIKQFEKNLFYFLNFSPFIIAASSDDIYYACNYYN